MELIRAQPLLHYSFSSNTKRSTVFGIGRSSMASAAHSELWHDINVACCMGCFWHGYGLYRTSFRQRNVIVRKSGSHQCTATRSGQKTPLHHVFSFATDGWTLLFVRPPRAQRLEVTCGKRYHIQHVCVSH